MKAAFIRQVGAPDMIEWGELPIPEIKDDEILVKVAAVPVNHVDTYIRAGKFQMDKPLPMPFIIGTDMVGTVERIGAHVTQFKPGERVWSNNLGVHGRQGSFAEYVAVAEDLLYHVPKNVDDRAVVSVVHAGATAFLGLMREAHLKVSDTVFVNGGGGGVGSAVIQIAKARGAGVFASTSGSEKMEWCKSLGADVVLDYRKDNVQEKMKTIWPQGINVFWDTSRQPNFDLSVSMMANKGQIILMAGADARPQFPVGLFYRKNCALKGFNLLQSTNRELHQCADFLNLCLERKQLKGKIAKLMPLSEAATAHMMMETSPEIWGKIILTV